MESKIVHASGVHPSFCCSALSEDEPSSPPYSVQLARFGAVFAGSARQPLEFSAKRRAIDSHPRVVYTMPDNRVKESPGTWARKTGIKAVLALALVVAHIKGQATSLHCIQQFPQEWGSQSTPSTRRQPLKSPPRRNQRCNFGPTSWEYGRSFCPSVRVGNLDF